MKRAQKGFGLIEVMISLVIGLVLLLGLTTILMSMTRTSDLRRKMAQVQGGQRMALSLVGNALRYAGSFPYSPSDTAATVFPASSPFAVGQSVSGTGQSTDTANTVTVRFVASTSLTASQGCSVSLVAGHKYKDVFSVSGGYLKCTETDMTAASAANEVNLVGGLTGMTVLYGVDSTGGGFTTQYLDATEVAAVTAPIRFWDNVKTVKLTLIFDNPLKGEAGQSATVSVTQTIPHVIGL